MKTPPQKKKVSKEVCYECGQIIDHQIWLKHTQKKLIKQGLPNLAKVLSMLPSN